MKKLFLSVILACFVAAGIQGATFAQEHKKFKKPNHPAFSPVNNPGLNLTEEQRAKAKEIREKSRDKIKPLFEEIKAEKQKFKEMVGRNASKEELKIQREKIHNLIKRAQEIRKQNLASFEQILTPEQKVQFNEIKQQKHEKMKNMQEKMHKNMQDRKNKHNSEVERLQN